MYNNWWFRTRTSSQGWDFRVLGAGHWVTLLWLVRSAALTGTLWRHKGDQLLFSVCDPRAKKERFCKILLNSLKMMAVVFLHLLSNPSSKSPLCTYSCCFSTWFHTWIIFCLLFHSIFAVAGCQSYSTSCPYSITSLVFSSLHPKVLQLELLFLQMSLLHPLLPVWSPTSLLPFLEVASPTPLNFRKVMSRLEMFWKWCFLSSLYYSLEDGNFHCSCGRNHFQSFCLELHSRRFVSMARSRPEADQGLGGVLAGSITCLGSSSPEVWELLPLVREVWCCNCFFQLHSLQW